MLAMAQTSKTAAPKLPTSTVFFENRVRPVIIKHCLPCHSNIAGKHLSALSMDTVPDMLRGGNSGPLIAPGKPSESLFVQVLRHSHKTLKMPPTGPLPETNIADIEKWIRDGAIDPRGAQTLSTKVESKDEKEWAYKPISTAIPPTSSLQGWAKTPIDYFVSQGQAAHQLSPAVQASGDILLRRIALDITGLAPSAADYRAFPKVPTDQDIGLIVDKYLASEEYGRRWGRHWLDIARYAESSGKTANIPYPEAWRYRDYVIDSFNKNKPYDQFIRENIAGDLLPSITANERADRLIATAYLAIGSKSHTERNIRQFRLDVTDEQIDAIGQGILGLTIACARCHNHKTDPISQRDYYQLAGIFLSSDTSTASSPTLQQRDASAGITLPPDADVLQPGGLSLLEQRRLLRQRDELTEQMNALSKRGTKVTGLAGLTQRINTINYQLSRFNASGKLIPTTMGITERILTENCPIYERGERAQPGETVPRGIPNFLGDSQQPEIQGNASGRLEIANWLSSKKNPLTARVFVNRIWHYLFGRGMVLSCDNFGVTGTRPDHPKLLDYLAQKFMESDWNIKQLIRDIVLSKTYRQDSKPTAIASRVDPENIWLSHATVKRMDAESIRDNILLVSGTLNFQTPRASPVVRMNVKTNRDRSDSDSDDMPYRSVYLPIIRDALPDSLAVFDMAEPSLVVGVREETTVPSQALFLLNAPFVIQASIRASNRLPKSSGSIDNTIDLTFKMILGRSPSMNELLSSRAFVQNFTPTIANKSAFSTRANVNPEQTKWVVFCQSLIATAEFRTIR